MRVFPTPTPDISAVARRYDQAARHYDKLADVVFERWLDIEQYRARLIAMLGDIEGAKVIDLGCGTGRNFPLLMRAIGPRGRLIGIDCSEGMLAQAARRVELNGWTNVALVRDDAVELATVTEPVDAFVVAWCYGEVEPLNAALERALEVIRPGGHFAAMSFARPRPASGPLHWLYPFYRLAARCMGIDTAAALDSRKVTAKWDAAIGLLRSRLVDFRLERYADDALLALAGVRP